MYDTTMPFNSSLNSEVLDKMKQKQQQQKQKQKLTSLFFTLASHLTVRSLFKCQTMLS